MILLTLDQARVCGFCYGVIGAPASELCFGSIDLGKHDTGQFLGQWRRWLDQMMRDVRPERVCFESPYVPVLRGQPMNAVTLRRLMAMAGYIEEVADAYGIGCFEATTLEMSRFLLGRVPRKVEKKALTVEAVKRYGFDVGADDAADAVALWLLSEATLAPEIGLRRGVGPLFAVDKSHH